MNMYVAAKQYVEKLGWPVLPLYPVRDGQCQCRADDDCQSPGKHPLSRHGVKDATTDVQRLKAWWSEWPDAGVGVAAGADAGFFVLDVDERHGGEDSLAALVAEVGELPETVEQLTGGGRHILFRHPGGTIKNGTSELGAGLDVKGDGGYVVVAPTLHHSRKRYAWEDECHPLNVTIAEAPAALLEKLQGGDRKRSSTLTGPIGEGQRNDELTSIAGSMRRRGYGPDAILERLKEVNESRCDPQLAERELQQIAGSVSRYEPDEAAHQSERVAQEFEQSEKPAVLLPGLEETVTHAAEQLGQLMAATGRYYERGGAVVRLDQDEHGETVLKALKASELPAAFESVAKLHKLKRNKDASEPVPSPCSEAMARLIMGAPELREALPTIRVVSEAPVVTEHNGELVIVTGYDAKTGILAGGDPLPEVSTSEAVQGLLGLLRDFNFSGDGDKSRALAALVTPALVFGGLLPGRPPVDLGEADESQSGKGYRNKLTAALYRQQVRTIAQRKSGVGSLEEAFNSALIRGANFIAIDNVRGKLDSPAIESFLTEDRYSARVAYQPDIELDPRRVQLMMTSNRAEITEDLANRASCVRIQKQGAAHQFTQYAEGDVLDHVRAWQSYYLGCVFSVIQRWHAAGKPRTGETRHDFRPWAQALDWIVQHVFQAAPLLNGHQQTQRRMANPQLQWLRDICLALKRTGDMDKWLRPHEILNSAWSVDVQLVPGIQDEAELDQDEGFQNAARAIGRKLAKCLSEDSEAIGGFAVERDELACFDYKTRKHYRFTANTRQCPPMSANGDNRIGGQHKTGDTPDLQNNARQSANGSPKLLAHGEVNEIESKGKLADWRIGGSEQNSTETQQDEIVEWTL